MVYMTNFLLKSLSPTAAKIYGLLENKQPMPAKEIGKHLRIFPNAVYRDVEELIEMGLVEEVKGRPIRYQAKNKNVALELCAAIIKQNFQEAFGSQNVLKGQPFQVLQLRFIHNRSELLANSDKDVKSAKYQLNYILSGHEVPADTILGFKRATDRGVKIRVLAQQLTKDKQAMFTNWAKVGVDVRYYPSIEARIFTIDRHIVYFTSYKSNDIQEAIGMRFDYAPYASLMDELFEHKWKHGKVIG